MLYFCRHSYQYMTFTFHKYQGTGNDFVIIDNRQLFFPKDDTKLINTLCDRKFGIGADGLILLENHPELDFTMVYYNADGNSSSMCGNGGRCICAFAKALSIINQEATFEAIDGVHTAHIEANGKVHLKMNDVSEIVKKESYSFLDTGSPHHIALVDNVAAIDVKAEGAKVRYSGLYGEAGSNINFVQQQSEDRFRVRTYERGVEDETLSCGTGVTAVALAMYDAGLTRNKEVTLEVEGGELGVIFKSNDTNYTDIYLVGPATFVYKGEWVC